MKTTFAVTAALVRLAASQSFDFNAILQAPSPSVTGPPLTAVGSQAVTFLTGSSLSASISSQLTVAAASVTGTSTVAVSTIKPTSSTLATAVRRRQATTTTSSTTACPTTPEDGTYCGFINPEDPCAIQPDGNGPKVTPDTVSAFQAYAPFHAMASAAPTTVGKYKQVFRDYNASTSANSYISLNTLSSYNVSQCAAYCDANALCTAFNIYIERDPSLNPTTNATYSAWNCPNPSSITNYKCTLWGSTIDNTTATNAGDWREQFQVVVVASNGYDKTNTTTPTVPCPGFSQPQTCGGKAINLGSLFTLGSQFFPGPYNPSVCQVYADQQAAINKKSAQAKGRSFYTPVNMFNAYMVTLNGKPQGTYCTLYDVPLSPLWAQWAGQWSSNKFFGCQTSYIYSRQTLDNGKC
jgi:hypothetical protein